MNHSVFKPSALFKISALSAALGVLAPLPALAATSNADVAKQLEALSRRVQELEQKLAEKNAPAKSSAAIDQETDQRIRVLDRKLEIANEDAAATKAAATKAKSDADKKASLLPTVYGRINIAYEKRDLEGAENIIAGNPITTSPGVSNRTRLESYASRLGFKGEVPLDTGDLKAIYQLEYEVNVDDGANGDTAFTQRNTFAGLKSATYGQIIAGKIDTPFKSAEGKFDQFNDLRGDIDNLIGGQNRVSKTAIYSTPKLFDVVTANFALVDSEDADVDYDGGKDDGIGDAFSTSIIAEQGIFYGALAYDHHVSARRSVDATIPLNPASAPIGYAKQYTKAYRAVGGIKWDIWEGGILLQRAEGLGPTITTASTNNPAVVSNNSKREDHAYLLSGAVNVLPKVKLKAQYGISNGDFSDEKGTLAAFGVDYNFTPKTKVYSYYSTLNLDKADVTDKTLAVGLDHSF
jgi:predicted porin